MFEFITDLFKSKPEEIQQLEQEINKKLPQIALYDIFGKNGYAVDENNQVVDLNLDDLELTNIPNALIKLKNLQTLSLFNNKIEKLPTSFGQLQNLTELKLWNNQLKELPASFGQLQNLSKLDLSENQLKELPPSFGQLQNLSSLWLQNNQLKELPASFGQLKNLQKSYINNNKINRLSEKILDLNLEIIWTTNRTDRIEKGIAVGDNPLTSPPLEVITQGRQAIIDYFDSLKAETQAVQSEEIIDKPNLSTKPLNEIKILLVGDGGAGKTSLLKQLNNQDFDAQESQTHGINIQSIKLSTQNDQQEDIEVTGHLWDFGGQEIMHATHQFFLSQRSLYILVADGRKDEKIEYWLKHIESFGDNSPVLVVLNKMDENPGFEVNQPFLREKYTGIHSFHRISCKDKIGINELQQAISKALTEVEILQTVWGQSWFEVKTTLENLTKHYVSHQEYIQLCENHKISDTAQNTLIQFLHDLGVIIHFKDFDLRDTYVLEPKWVTEAVYKIINAPQLAKNQGILQLNTLDEILKPKNKNDYKYPVDKQRYIILLMEKFELCYKINNETILIPDLLPVSQPQFNLDYDNALKFKLKYDFLPRSIMPKFIVKRHKDILNQIHWRTGVVLHDKNYKTTAVIKSDNEDKNIQIWVTGQQKRDYFATIRKTLWDLHNDFEKLAVTELVPLPDHPKMFVTYKNLIGHYVGKQENIFVGEVGKAYSVKKLLGDIESETRTQTTVQNINIYGNVDQSNISHGNDIKQQIRK